MFKIICKSDSIDCHFSTNKPYQNCLVIQDSVESGGAELEQTYVCFSKNEGRVKLRAPLGTPVPLFYGFDGQGLIISDTLSLLLEEHFNGVSFDHVAILESLIFDAPLSYRTLYKGVFKVRGGEEVIISLNERGIVRNWHWLPKLQSLKGRYDRNALLQSAKSHVLNLTNNVKLDKGESLILPLSGGYDSRLLAVLFKEKMQLNPISYTFGRGWSIESIMASKVASHMNIPHYTFNLGVDCYKNYAKKVVLRTGGMVTAMHTHGMYCCEILLPENLRLLPRMFGHFAGPLAGENTLSQDISIKIKSPEDILSRFDHSIYRELIKYYRNDILSDIDEIYQAFLCSGSGEQCLFDFWRIIERQSSLLTHIFSYHRSELDVEILLPFINKSVLDFFFSLPFEERYDRRLYKDAFRSLYPDIYNIPSVHYGNNSYLHGLEKMFNVACNIADKFDIKQEVLLSPFRFEQHEKNLVNYLHDEVSSGMVAMSKLFNCEVHNPFFPTWKKSSIVEYYRLASLGYLYEQLYVV